MDDIISNIAERQRQGEVFCIATVVRAQAATAAKAGCKALVDANGAIQGFIGGACVQGAVQRTAQEVLQSGVARLIRIKPADKVHAATDEDGVEVHKSGCPSRGTVDIFIEPMSPPPLLVVVGVAPVAIALAEQGVLMGYRVLVASADIDDADKFPSSVQHQADFDLSDAGIGEKDFVVVATQGRGDLAALNAVISTKARYISMVCSRAKAATLCAKLQNAGEDSERLARLKAPAGLDIQAIEPREIALSILAEIIMRRRQGSRHVDAPS